ncbi:MAG TPA: cell division protein FtsL [Acidiferrobacterales bacterium]|nr:cell division protein FtsL [Acidiferrobacterales bacterium]
MRKQLALLTVAMVACALTVIELRHRNRLLFAELQTVTHERDALNTEWGQLLLEQGAWSEQRRVEETARARLGMALPAGEQVVVVRTDKGASRVKP